VGLSAGLTNLDIPNQQKPENVKMKSMVQKATESPHYYSLYFASGVLARQIEKMAKETWKPSGLHPSHAHLLRLILDGSASFSTSCPTFLSKDLLLSPSTITRLLEKLEKKELITRFSYEHLVVVLPTQKARELAPLLEQCENTFAMQCHELLGEQETFDLSLVLTRTTDLLAKRTARTA